MALLKGILEHFGGDLCSGAIGKHLGKAALMMMELGDIYSSERFFKLVLRENQGKLPCFCNTILRVYIKDGAREICGKTLRKLAARSLFQPTDALITRNALMNQYSRERLMTDVLPSLPMVRFIETTEPFPNDAMEFLAGLPPNVKVVSARSHLVGATSSFLSLFCIQGPRRMYG